MPMSPEARKFLNQIIAAILGLIGYAVSDTNLILLAVLYAVIA